MKRISPKRAAHKRRKIIKVGQVAKVQAAHARIIKSHGAAIADLEAIVAVLARKGRQE